MNLELVKYRDAGMQTYTYFWKDENQHTVSPFFNSETAAMNWANEKPDPKVLDDARAEDEEFERIGKLK